MTTIYCLHIPGPDDVYAAPSKEAAEMAAKDWNEFIRAHRARVDAQDANAGVFDDISPPLESSLASVIEWPHSAESHAEAVKLWNQDDWRQKKPNKNSAPEAAE
jgi:hypothetical protein